MEDQKECPILLCGVGALGSHAAYSLRNHPGPITLVDMDRVETKNIKNQLFTTQTVGKNKADALRLVLFSSYGAKNFQSLPVEIGPHNVETLMAQKGLVVDCLDNYQGRKLLAETANRLKIPIVHAGITADASAGFVTWDLQDEDERAGQTPPPPTCQDPSVLPAHMVLASLLAQTVRVWTGPEQDRFECRFVGGSVWSFKTP